MISLFLRLVVLGAVLLFGRSIGIAAPSPFPPNDGALYKADFVKAIQTADRIVVTEHSDRSDFPQEEVNRKDLPKYVYGRVELSPAAKAAFLKDAMAMDATTRTSFTVCIFEGHHTIEFYSSKKRQSKMEICFKCGDIIWDGSQRIQSYGMLPVLMPLIADIGFQQKRDWKALRVKAAEAAGR